MFVGIGQRGVRWRAAIEVNQFPLAASEAIPYLTQAVGPGHLAKQHGDKLIPTGESPGMAFGLVIVDGSLEVVPGKEL